MQVRELMTSPAYTCRPDDSLEHAARLLWEHDCGMLPVVDAEGRTRAVITDRDICMGAYTRGRPLAALPVTDSMSRRLVTCRADEDLAVIARRMAEHQLHRLPVVDDQGRACGVLSLNDLALAGERDAAAAREAMRVLTAACRSRTAVPAPVTIPAPAPRPAAAAAPRPAATAGAAKSPA